MNSDDSNSNLILLVEDDSELTNLLGMLLRRVGFEVCSADTAQHGLALAQERRPALAVLDIALPDFNGLELCRQLKADLRTAYMPVVFFTGYMEKRAAAFAAGGADFMIKPSEVIELPARICQVLKNKVI